MRQRGTGFGFMARRLTTTSGFVRAWLKLRRGSVCPDPAPAPARRARVQPGICPPLCDNVCSRCTEKRTGRAGAMRKIHLRTMAYVERGPPGERPSSVSGVLDG
jgi:hypothetical protein